MPDTARNSRKKSSKLVNFYTRIWEADLQELQKREQTTGAKPAAQARILIHEGLQKPKRDVR